MLRLPSSWKSTVLLTSLLSLGFLGQEKPAFASNFGVSPIQIYLAPKADRAAASTMLSIRNESSNPLRFQVSAFTWSQTTQNPIQLEPTEDIIFFPNILSLAPGESRTIRLGVTASPTEQEKTYRILVEELPPLKTAKPVNTTPQVQVLTKMSIPIFIQPTQSQISGEIQEISAEKGHVAFQVKNTGNTHFTAQQVRVKGYGAALDKPVFDRSTAGWYILAKSARSFDLEVPKADCAKVQSVTIEVQYGKNQSFTQSTKTPNGLCPVTSR
ncbi:molecular chaperone [Alkalinema pantanalense CENA528]|uniref:fimbrial biogenesis chaperone n=1 Tax=Alkalinema pantanalense TaxID=1620705 RepID=UPI003D6DFB72